MLNGTCTLLQVRRVSTVISRTETRWENAIEKIENAIQMRVRVRVRARNLGSVANPTGELGAPDIENASKRRNNNKTIHNAQQRTVGYGAKRLVNLI